MQRSTLRLLGLLGIIGLIACGSYVALGETSSTRNPAVAQIEDNLPEATSATKQSTKPAVAQDENNLPEATPATKQSTEDWGTIKTFLTTLLTALLVLFATHFFVVYRNTAKDCREAFSRLKGQRYRYQASKQVLQGIGSEIEKYKNICVTTCGKNKDLATDLLKDALQKRPHFTMNVGLAKADLVAAMVYADLVFPSKGNVKGIFDDACIRLLTVVETIQHDHDNNVSLDKSSDSTIEQTAEVHEKIDLAIILLDKRLKKLKARLDGELKGLLCFYWSRLKAFFPRTKGANNPIRLSGTLTVRKQSNSS